MIVQQFSGATPICMPLAAHEIDRLSSLLEQLGDARSLDVEYVDGFCAALVAGPAAGELQHCVEALLTENLQTPDAYFLQELMQLVQRHWQSLDEQLRRGELVGPLVNEECEITHLGQQWARGFLRAVRMHHRQWAMLLYDRQQNAVMIPIMTAARESATGLPWLSGRVTEVSRPALLTDMALALMHIYALFSATREAESGKPSSTLH